MHTLTHACPLQAFCEPQKVEGNGILAFARYVLFPILAGDGKRVFAELYSGWQKPCYGTPRTMLALSTIECCGIAYVQYGYSLWQDFRDPLTILTIP